jgi:hypothetical protein
MVFVELHSNNVSIWIRPEAIESVVGRKSSSAPFDPCGARIHSTSQMTYDVDEHPDEIFALVHEALTGAYSEDARQEISEHQTPQGVSRAQTQGLFQEEGREDQQCR